VFAFGVVVLELLWLSRKEATPARVVGTDSSGNCEALLLWQEVQFY
jgi:hypothetical protein